MYKKIYDTDKIRNKEYCVTKYIQKYYKNENICLDLGCGSCRKILDISKKVQYYYAIDSDFNRIIEAKNNIKEINNIKLGVADNFYLPFADNKFDLVSCFMSKYNIAETSRVLKKGGIFIIETLGANDKRDIKKKFGKDEIGWRGRLLYDSTNRQLERISMSLSPFFNIKKFYCKVFKTSIKSDDLLELFEMTNEIRLFDKKKDKYILDELEDENGYISFNEERLIIICEKI